MKQIKTYQNKNILVLGLGKSGFAVSKLLLKLGANLTLNDQADLTNNEHAKKLRNLGVCIISGTHPVDLFDHEQFDFLVKNPGISYDNPMVKKARENAVPIITEPQIALAVSDTPYIAVTGSNGKTTTVMLTQQILDHHLKKNGHHAYAVGNIGVPISEVVPYTTKDDILVVEMSSFQLLGVSDIKPQVAAIVDIYNNVHLDYHKSFSNYVNAKLNITRNQTSEQYFLANYDQKDILMQEKTASNAHILTFSEKETAADFFIAAGYLQSKKEKIMKTADMKLPGLHNQQDALVASAISLIMGASLDDIRTVLATFTGAKHRLQYVMTLEGRQFYNDSKSTNIEAASVAIPAFNAPEVWLAGGLDRGFNFDELVPLIKEHVRVAVFYGETRYLLADAARKAGVEKIIIKDTLQEAVPEAYQVSKSGEVLLFSPACASWDQFRTFEERGDYFIKFVKELKTK